eukprot:CAMPEP_0178428218 /NCGR_PEP_ID=MMETSP0689_2-20121128/30162_1 /TAXON_ID=160604 /ORGANISM="Amphidinium massartii, Strain CS-259" /LENGTH=237 /DNA_ID=CAMNT_0020049979 /DNA_START=95 /DNA_END=805 /DNA_ORIENTATION=+
MARPGAGRQTQRWVLLAVVALCSSSQFCWLLPGAQREQTHGTSTVAARRQALLALGAASILAIPADEASAFKNAKEIRGGAKQTGPQPSEIGVLDRGFDNKGDEIIGLKQCRDGPNCFSTTFESFDVGRNNIEPWTYTGKSGAQAMKEVKAAVEQYEPGQNGVDSGGFQIVEANDKYVYAQFQSLKGYVDDVEFALSPTKDGAVLLRSGSRLGYLDFAVNYLRIEAIATALQKNGGW